MSRAGTAFVYAVIVMGVFASAIAVTVLARLFGVCS
jgi:hypothetical protein